MRTQLGGHAAVNLPGAQHIKFKPKIESTIPMSLSAIKLATGRGIETSRAIGTQ